MAADNADPNNSEDCKIKLPIPPAIPACDTSYKYTVPDHLKPDSSKFYLVVDSVDGLRQLISKFASHENDLEIISRSTKSVSIRFFRLFSSRGRINYAL